jgi:hypothetical protein
LLKGCLTGEDLSIDGLPCGCLIGEDLSIDGLPVDGLPCGKYDLGLFQ